MSDTTVSTASYRLSSKLLSFVSVIEDFRCIGAEVKADLLAICKSYTTSGDDPRFLAEVHSDLVRDVELTAVQMARLYEIKSVELERASAGADLDARADLEAQKLRVTETAIKSRVALSLKVETIRRDLFELRALKDFTDGLRRGLYSRSVMVRILNDKNMDYDT